MNQKLLDLAARQGALRVRIALQREQLARHAGALHGVLDAGDSALRGVDWLKHHPLAVGAAFAAVVVARPRRVLRWVQRSFFLWRGWQALRKTLSGSR